MQIEYTEKQKQLRQQLRQYFSELISPDLALQIRDQEGGDLYRQLIRQMGKDGWLAIGWPEEYGGQGATAVEQLMFFEEALLAKAPIPFVTLNTVGPALMEYGSELQKQTFLPGIAAGEIHFAIGYTESEAGTDLAAMSTSAVKEGSHYIINGSKVFTSGAHDADFIWLAARTTKEVRHKGVTLFILDTRAPGFAVSPINTVGGFRTNMTYYDNVRVHESMVVGKVDRGWELIVSQLNHERVGLAAWGVNGWGLYRRTVDWARQKSVHGLRAIDVPWVQTHLASAFVLLEAMRIMNARMACHLDNSIMDPAFASGLKVYSTESIIEVCRLLMEVVGPECLICHDVTESSLYGDLEREYRRCQINTFGGGVNEVQRGIVANFGLDMPRHR